MLRFHGRRLSVARNVCGPPPAWIAGRARRQAEEDYTHTFDSCSTSPMTPLANPSPTLCDIVPVGTCDWDPPVARARAITQRLTRPPQST